MPRRSKGPRLYLDKKRGQWVIRDGTRFIRTGQSERHSVEAEKYLAQYIARKHKPAPSGAPLIADVLSVYGTEVAPSMKSARNIAYNISNLLKWWGDKTAAQISMKSCKAYAETRPSQAAAADLKILKVATDYWHKSEYGPLNFQPVFWRPKANPPKERWLTPKEAARAPVSTGTTGRETPAGVFAIIEKDKDHHSIYHAMSRLKCLSAVASIKIGETGRHRPSGSQWVHRRQLHPRP